MEHLPLHVRRVEVSSNSQQHTEVMNLSTVNSSIQLMQGNVLYLEHVRKLSVQLLKINPD